jgi:acetolactate synthase-1/2/3 large subunit
MLDLHNPELDWVRLAGGMGVEASRAETIADFEAHAASAIAARGPRLIEAVL